MNPAQGTPRTGPCPMCRHMAPKHEVGCEFGQLERELFEANRYRKIAEEAAKKAFKDGEDMGRRAGMPEGMVMVTIEPRCGKNYEAGIWSRRNWEAALEDQAAPSPSADAARSSRAPYVHGVETWYSRHPDGGGAVEVVAKSDYDYLATQRPEEAAEQEPIAWRWRMNEQQDWRHLGYAPVNIPQGAVIEPLYAFPWARSPQATPEAQALTFFVAQCFADGYFDDEGDQAMKERIRKWLLTEAEKIPDDITIQEVIEKIIGVSGPETPDK